MKRIKIILNLKKIKIKKISAIYLIFLIIFSWIFSGWPQIWQKPAIPPKIQEALAQGNNGAMMVYAKAADTTPYYRTWDEATDAWSAEGSVTAVSGTIQFMVLRFSRTRNEGILGTLDSTGDIRTQVWNGTSWSATTLHANVGTTNDIYRGFDIAYETSGDRAIIVFNDANSADPAYQIWDGTSWSAKTSITAPPTTGAPWRIELASNPLSASNEIAMMLIDANVDIYGMVWNGTSWDDMGDTAVWDTTGAIATKESIDVAYEQTSGEAMFIWADSVKTDQYYRIWNGSTLTAATLLDIPAAGGVGNWVRLAPRPNSDEIMYGLEDAANDLNTRKWSGSAWDTATEHPEHDGTGEQNTTRYFDIAWETHSANAGKAWLVWGNSAKHSRKQWSGTAWGTAAAVGDDTAWIRLEAQPTSGTFFNMIFQDANSASDDILEEHLVDGGTTWSSLFTVWAGPVVEVTYEPFDIASMRYVPPSPFTNQSAFRWRNDNGSESTATWKDTENAAITGVSLTEIIRLRLEIEETNGGATTVNARLEFSSDATSCTTGTWTTLDTSTTAWRVTASGNITNGDPTTNQLTTSAKTFAAGRIFDTQNEDTTGVSLSNTHTEWEWAIRGDGAVDSTTYRFRVTDAGTALNTYTNCGQLTTAAVYSITLDQANFAYGNMPDNTASSTLTLWSEAGIIATNGDAIADFYIYGADTANWTLDSATSTPDYYTHKFCNETDNNCLASGPYGADFTALATSTQLLKGSVAASGQVAFQLSMHTPNPSSVYTEQSAVVTVQASAP